MLNLPDSLREFLELGRQLVYDITKCEAGQVVLHKVTDLVRARLLVNMSETELETEDPHEGAMGYVVPAVSLTADCDGYQPDFLLLWLPNENLFGWFDCEHGHLGVFPGVTWDDIVDDPVPYLNAQWNPNGPSELFRPWPNYEFTNDEDDLSAAGFFDLDNFGGGLVAGPDEA
ncbi:MAG: hypothetical protein ACLQVD_17835 [Capsulimonadaceae bacterium]